MKKIMMNARMNVVVVFVLEAMLLTGCSGFYVKYYGFTVDGLDYSILDETETVEVSCINEMIDPEGAVSVPGTVLFSGVDYAVVKIAPVAFYDCVSITRLFLPESVTEIGNGAFAGCENLHAIHCSAVVPPTIGEDTFDETTCQNAVLYVPYPSIYKEAEGWKNFERIEAIK